MRQMCRCITIWTGSLMERLHLPHRLHQYVLIRDYYDLQEIPPSPLIGVIFLPRKTWSPLGGGEITDFGIHPLPGRRKPTAMEGGDGRTERSGVICAKRSPIPPPDYKSASIHPTSAIRSSVCTSPGCICRIKDVANLKLGNIYFPPIKMFFSELMIMRRWCCSKVWLIDQSNRILEHSCSHFCYRITIT